MIRISAPKTIRSIPSLSPSNIRLYSERGIKWRAQDGSDDRAGTSQDGDQDDFDGDVQRENGGRVDVQDVLGVKSATDGG